VKQTGRSPFKCLFRISGSVQNKSTSTTWSKSARSPKISCSAYLGREAWVTAKKQWRCDDCHIAKLVHGPRSNSNKASSSSLSPQGAFNNHFASCLKLCLLFHVPAFSSPLGLKLCAGMFTDPYSLSIFFVERFEEPLILFGLAKCLFSYLVQVLAPAVTTECTICELLLF
jgi:hypothetical protein